MVGLSLDGAELGDRIRREPAKMLKLLRRTPLFLLLDPEFIESFREAMTGSSGNPVTELLYESQQERYPPELRAYFVEAAALAAENPEIAADIYQRTFDNIVDNRIGTTAEIDLLTGAIEMDIAEEIENAPPRPEGWSEEDVRVIVAQGDNGNVRITEAPPPPQYPCIVGPYSTTRCAPWQKHHIVPDYTKRFGPGRGNANRIKGVPPMPTLNQGYVVCMRGNAGTAGTPHNIAQTTTRRLTESMAATGTPPGTITVRQAMWAGAVGAIAARPECAAVIVGAVNAEFLGMPRDRLMNGMYYPATLSPTARAALVAGQ